MGSVALLPVHDWSRKRVPQFARPKSGKIAVKVINDYGDEIMKVFEVS